MNLSEYVGNYERFLKRYEAIYAPKIRKEIRNQIKTYLESDISKISSEGMQDIILDMHIKSGTYWANMTNRMFKTPTKKSRHDRFSEYMYSLLRTYMIIDAFNTAENITQTTIDDIKQILYDATILNWSLRKIEQELLNQRKIRIRSLLITRTELLYGSNTGAYLWMKDTGLDWRKKWVALLDNRTRRDHRILNWQVRPLNDPFEVVNKFGVLVKMQYPGDRSLGAGPDQICNCRCFLVYE